MSVQNSAQAAQQARGGFVGYAAGVMRPGPALGYDLVRAYLGIGLFVRGVLFVSQPELVLGYLQDVHGWFLPGSEASAESRVTGGSARALRQGPCEAAPFAH